MSQPQTLASQQYSFDPGAMVIVQMGEQLIGHPSTAIGELVKNGYDADATECHVYIHTDPEPSKTFLVIFDNGLGMDKSILFGNWLRPSISSKRDPNPNNRISAIFERNYLGSKGIGRLAAMALGRYVTVITKTSSTEEYNWLKIDRDAFKTDQGVTEVKFPGGQIKETIDQLFTNSDYFPAHESNDELIDFLQQAPYETFKEGTLIIIEEVDESVRTVLDDERDDMYLPLEDATFIKSLRELITPLALNRLVQNELVELDIIKSQVKIAKELSSFTVFYGTNDYSFEEGGSFLEVKPISILHNYDYRMIGRVAADSSVTGYYFCRRQNEEPEIKEYFYLPSSFVLEDNAKVFSRRKRDAIPVNIVDAQTGDFFFDIRVYDRDTDALDKLGLALHLDKKKAVRDTLDRYLGFRISKNGFGVKPYGEEQKDWLGINLLRVQDPAHVIGVNQILGNAFLYSPQNDGLSEKTNREGFFENKAFITFKKVMRGVLAELGQRRFNYRTHYNLGRTVPDSSFIPDFNSYLKFIESRIEDPEVRTRTKKFVEDTTTALESLQNSLTLSQRLASLGSGLELVYHELSQPLSVMGSSQLSLETRSKRLTDETIRKRFLDETDSLRVSIEALDKLKKSLQPAIGKSSPEDFKPYNTFQKICYLFKKDLENLDITVLHDDELENYEICEQEYVFWVAFLNIMNNAVYWLSQSEDERKIIFRLDDGVMSIANSSSLIPEDKLEDIFKYGVSLRKGGSTGLGLTYTKNMLTQVGWDIEATNAELGPSFSIKKQTKADE